MTNDQLKRLIAVLLLPVKWPIFTVTFPAQVAWMAYKWVRTGTPIFTDAPWAWVTLTWPAPNSQKEAQP